MYNRLLLKNVILFLSYLTICMVCYFILDRLCGSRDDFQRDQHTLSIALVYLIYAHIFFLLFYHRKSIRGGVVRFFGEAISPYNIAVFRIGFYLFLILMYGYQYHHSFAPYRPDMTLVPLKFTGWYLNFIPISRQLYAVMYYSGCMVALCCAIGLGNRYIAWLSIVFSFYIIGMPMFLGKMFYMHMWFWISSFMAFAPSTQVLSLDWAIKRIKGKYVDTAPHFKYGLALKFIWIHFGIIYFFSAIYKLKVTGLSWALGPNMINQIQLEWLQNYYDIIPVWRVDKYPALLHTGGMVVLCMELLFIFFIFSKKYKWLAVAGGLSMHQMATYLMNISFADLQFLYLSFLDVRLFKSNSNANDDACKSDVKLDAGSRATLIIGAIYFAFNSLFGFFNIDSWPFSCYPAHNSDVAQTYKRVEFEINSGVGYAIKVDSIGRKNNFRKDNYFAIDEKVVKAVEQKDTIAQRRYLHLLWNIWQSNNPELTQYDTPQPYLIETPVDPEKRKVFIQKKNLVY